MAKKEKLLVFIITFAALLLPLLLLLLQPSGYTIDSTIQTRWMEASQHYYNSNYTESKNLFESIYNDYPRIKNKNFLLNLIALYSHLSMEPELKVIAKRLLHFHGHDKALVDYIYSLSGSMPEIMDIRLFTYSIKYIIFILLFIMYAFTVFFILVKKNFPYLFYLVMIVLILFIYLYWNFPSFFIHEGITIEEIKVYDFPLEEAQKYFTVPSAISVNILNETSFFYRVRTKNGKEGWVLKNKILKVYND